MSIDFSKMFSLSRDAVVVISGDRITDFNNAAKNLFGDLTDSVPSDIFPEPVLFFESDKFSGAMNVGKKSCALTAVTIDDYRIITVSVIDDENARRELISLIGTKLKTHIADIKMSSDILRPYIEETGSDKMMRYHQIITKSSYRLHRAVGNMSFFASYDSNHFRIQNIDVNALFKGLPLSVETLCDESDIKVRYIPHNKPLCIHADPEKLKLAVYQLISNSVKAVDKGGEITVSITPRGSWVVIDVTDNGCGISEDKLSDVWATAKTSPTSPYDGMGTGLPIVRYIAQLHGGTALLESNPGMTRVSIVIPKGKAAADNILCSSQMVYESGISDIMLQLSDSIPYTKFSEKYMN